MNAKCGMTMHLSFLQMHFTYLYMFELQIRCWGFYEIIIFVVLWIEILSQVTLDESNNKSISPVTRILVRFRTSRF